MTKSNPQPSVPPRTLRLRAVEPLQLAAVAGGRGRVGSSPPGG